MAVLLHNCLRFQGALVGPDAVGLTQAGHRFPHCSQIMATILEGQVELLMPALIAAIDAADSAAAKVKKLKLELITLIESPQTVPTTWGNVTLKKPARTIKVVDKELIAEITLLKEQGVKLGKCQVNYGAPVLSVSLTDKKK